MNTYKLLNIALVALIISLIVQMFMPKQQSNIENNAISFFTTSKSVTIPTLPTINIHNTTQNDFTFNTCENLEISANGKTIDLQKQFPNFCQDINVTANTQHTLNVSELKNIYSEPTGQHIYTLKKDDIKKNIVLEVENRGFIRTLASTLIYEPIYNLFAGILQYIPGHSLGWAIVIITVIIRLILLIPQHKMLESQRRMSEIQPKVRALQEEYKGNPELGIKLLELYKKEGVSPMGSCLPFLIQMPILFALYAVITGITDISNQFHLYPFLKDFNPTLIDAHFFGIDLRHVGGTIAIVAALVLILTQWLQGYITIKAQPPLPKSTEKKEPKEGEIPSLDPAIMQKITLYFLPFLVGISALFFPIGLALYWWIGILFTIAQQMFVNARANTKKSKGEIIKK